MLLLSLVRVLTGGWSIGIDLLWWWLGGIIGYGLALSEDYIYVYKEGKRGSLRVIKSILFLLVWVFLGFWTVTSVPSMFGRGIVFGIGAFLSLEFFYDFFHRKENLHLWFYQIKRKLDEKEIRIVSYALLVLYALLLLNL